MSAWKKTGIDVINIKYYAMAVVAMWTLALLGSWMWNSYQGNREIVSMARAQARVAYERDVIYRRWNTMHGGVYVPVSKTAVPNPHLNVPDRDIVDTSGRRLTLMNPAYMTRQVHELAKREYGVMGHITSLKPIRPANAPDKWETEALKSFEQGATEASSIEEIDGKSYMRLMRPLVTEDRCLECHAEQGYKVGDIRGGISVAMPMAPLWAIERSRMHVLLAGHAAIWLIGAAGIAFGAGRLARQINKRKKAEEALQATNRRLLEAEALKEDLINMIVHDMKGPVANTIIGLDVFRLDSEEGLTEQQRHYLELAKRNQFKLSEMMTNLLEISKIESKVLEIKKSTFSLPELIERIVDHCSLIIEEEENVVTVAVEPPVESISSDEHLLERVLSNLLSNAVRHSYPKGEIVVRAVPDEAKSGVTISVQDFGEGIPKEYHQKIFEKFGQAAGRALGKKTDSGLGLAFCKMAVEAMRGTISVESTPGQGSCFTVSLPDAVEE